MTVPDIMKHLLLAPIDGELGEDGVWIKNYGERMTFRGGAWSFGASAGLFSLSFYSSRTCVYPNIGFRPAFVL